MGILISFSGGVRVLSRETGEVLREYAPGVLLKLKNGKLVQHIMSTAEWVARQLANAPQFTQAQINQARWVKRELIELADARTSMPMSA